MLFQALTALFFSMPQQNVVCWKNDCLKYGWTQVNNLRTQFTEHQCYQMGCETSGWIAGGNQNLRYYTQCKNKNCFKNGWYYLDRDTHELLGNVVCKNNDCLTEGWITYFKQGPSNVTQCLENDCHHIGWVEKSNLNYAKIYCKENSCFKKGWKSN